MGTEIAIKEVYMAWGRLNKLRTKEEKKIIVDRVNYLLRNKYSQKKACSECGIHPSTFEMWKNLLSAPPHTKPIRVLNNRKCVNREGLRGAI